MSYSSLLPPSIKQRVPGGVPVNVFLSYGITRSSVVSQTDRPSVRPSLSVSCVRLVVDVLVLFFGLFANDNTSTTHRRLTLDTIASLLLCRTRLSQSI